MAKTTPKKVELTPFEQELKKAIIKVKEYKTICEANVVSLFWKNPDLLYSYSDLTIKDFHENMWKVYFAIAKDILLKERKILDEITVGFYLEKHPKLKDKVDEYGGYDKIISAGEYVNEGNIEAYINELHKWTVVIEMLKNKFPVYDRISEFVDMSLDEIYDEQNAILNHLFANAEGEIKSYDVAYNIRGLIDKLDKGEAIGLPYQNLPMLSKETGGMYLGGIHLVGALSNVGKSTFVRNTVIASCIEHNEPICVMLNEEGLEKFQRELLVWVANNIHKLPLQKWEVRDGNYNDDIKSKLGKAADYIEKLSEQKIITIVPLKKFKTSTAIKVINKHASLGYKMFVLDTFKADHDATSDNNWFIMQQAMVAINDVVKPESRNLSIVVTFQLGKESAKQRYYTQSNIGLSRSIIDPCSTCVMIRNLFEDEVDGGKREMKTYRLDGKFGKTKIPVKLQGDKKYQVLFIVKSREGSTDHQIVVEHSLGVNTIKEVGITHVNVDF